MAEHILYGKRKLCYTEVTDFTDFQGIGRDPLYKRFDSVYAVIEKNIEPQYRDFLAHPIYSNEDQILWFVREWNDVPCAYKELSATDKVKYSKIKEKTIAVYKEVLKNLSGEDKQIFIGAVKYIDEDFMFCYDDKVVVVAWGMTPDLHKHVVKGAVIYDLSIQTNHKITFVVGNNGMFSDKSAGIVSRPDGAVLAYVDLPKVTPKTGFVFNRWEPNPLGMKVYGPLTFRAVYDEVPVENKVIENNIQESKVVENRTVENETVHVTFIAGDGGFLNGATEYIIKKGTYLDISQIPQAIPDRGFLFDGWNIQPDKQMINDDTVFYANFSRKNVTCKFIAGENGKIEGFDSLVLPYGSIINNDNIPGIRVKKGYEFTGWDKSPVDYVLNEDTTFTAHYKNKLPWYKRLWAWFVGLGCLNWLLWILLFVIFLIFLSWLIRSCDDLSEKDGVESLQKIETSDGRILDDNGPIENIVDEDGKLPGHNIVAPIVGEDGQEPPIISNPGVPDIIANRLNIYFENSDVNLEQFVGDLAQLYPEEQCKVVGLDVNVPMIQIQISENIRDTIREKLNTQLPNYKFFIIDESLFAIVGASGVDTENVGWHLEAIDLKEGWKITKGNAEVIVAVVDDGIDASHDILKGKIVKPYNVFTRDNRLSLGNGHGTHVAGLAVGSDNMLAEGISGVAPECRLMPIQVFDNGLCTFSSVASGIMYAIHNGADVVNVSIGPNFKGLDILPIPEQDQIAKTQFKNEERVWKRIINVANQHNVIIVFAVGNDNILASIPPENRTNQTVNVAAVNKRIRGTDFTNFGMGANISAPGEAIVSSVPINKYDKLSGTSMAAPIVSGTIALMKSLNSELSVSEILHILRTTGEKVSEYIPPLIQVDDALIAIKTGHIPPIQPGHDNGNEIDSTSNAHATLLPEQPSNENSDTAENNSNKEEQTQKDIPDKNNNENDYDAIRKLIETYKRKIKELEKLLPENK